MSGEENHESGSEAGDDAGISISPVGAVINSAVNSGPGKALLTPAATVFGEYLGWRAATLTEKWKKQREKNLAGHAEKVSAREGAPIPREPTPQQFSLINEWAEGAQDVDPGSLEEPEIAALWQSLLGAIYRKSSQSRDWLDAIKQLTPNDARMLLRISDRFEATDGQEIKLAQKLVAIGLLEGFNWQRFLRSISIIALTGMVTLGVMWSLNNVFEAIPSYGEYPTALISRKIMSSLFPVTFISIALLIVSMKYFREYYSYRLTRLGRNVRSSALKYLARQPAPEHTATEEHTTPGS